MYCIYTICTKNFKDCYDFSIDSWLNNTNAEKIYIYTDDPEWVSDNVRIEIINLFDARKGWLVIVNNKVVASKHVLSTPFNRIVFVDIDCYLLYDLEHVFDKEFDFAVTRLNNSHFNVRVSTGIFFFNNTEKTYIFFDAWANLQLNVWGKEKACSQSQNAFSMLIRDKYKNGSYKVLDLDVDVYNRKTSKKQMPTVKDEFMSNKIKVLHFYNTSFRDKDFVKELFEKYNKW